MKKLIALLLILITVFALTACSASLPKGEASNIRVSYGDSFWDMGRGKFEYINETTVKFIRTYDNSVYYISSDNLVFIEVANKSK